MIDSFVANQHHFVLRECVTTKDFPKSMYP